MVTDRWAQSTVNGAGPSMGLDGPGSADPAQTRVGQVGYPRGAVGLLMG